MLGKLKYLYFMQPTKKGSVEVVNENIFHKKNIKINPNIIGLKMA